MLKKAALNFLRILAILVGLFAGGLAHAQQANFDWIGFLRGARFEGTLPDCIEEFKFNIHECQVVLEFTGVDQWGALTGTLDLGLKNKHYDVRFEYIPQSEDPYRIEIERPDYVRRLKSKGNTENYLDFMPGPGDTQATVIRMMAEENPERSLGFAFHQTYMMEQKTWMAGGTLFRK